MTARLAAEPLTAAHLPDLCRMDQNPAFMGYLGGPRDASETAAYLERNLRHWADYGFGLWMLRDTATQTVAGRAVLRHLVIEGRDDVEVGYAFFPEFWGRGLATEIATRLVDYGRAQLSLPTIVAITQPANLGSRRVLTKAGLTYERDVMHDGVPHVLFRVTFDAGGSSSR